MGHPAPDTISSLTIELQNFCNREGLPHECADDLLVTHSALTDPQRKWLTDYSARWDAINQPNASADTRETLTAELRAFCAKECLPQVSAEELIVNPALTPPQREWLAEFWGRWDALDTRDTPEILTNELRNFCVKEGLPQVNARALIANPALTPPQREWLTKFLARPASEWDTDDFDY